MATIEFYFDFASPYSYLASTQIAAVAERAGATLEPKPFLLGAVFKAVGNTPPGTVVAKAEYMLRDLQAWATEYGVPFKFNDLWPLNAIKAHRAVLAVDDAHLQWRAIQRIFKAFWQENLDISDAGELTRLFAELGLDAETILARTETQEIKDRLRANTDGAVARGAFGAPTMFVNGQMFVGNDRLAFVERAAKGEHIHA